MLYAKKISNFEIEYVNNCAAEELATVVEVEDYVCLAGDIPEGEFVEVKEGYILSGDEYGTSFFKRESMCPAMFSGILETYV